MKATGIVRRIDDLGRVVIPKEIRRTMRIREGDPLEIYTDAGGLVVFKKYSPMGELSSFASQYAEALCQGTELGVAITDSDSFLAASGMPKKDIIGSSVNKPIEQIISDRKTVVFSAEDSTKNDVVFAGRAALVVSPVIAAGDTVGSVILFGSENNSSASESDVKLAKVASSFLGKQMEG
ncbi:MAG: AbrB/MazE/SpoVT family DNA-binding domain-containing protein [Clostridiales bacterium]|nr:AbrB/MazE/SpoVT family DNA-binding domain-containing protein [Candidatus Equinaster intestinalis]